MVDGLSQSAALNKILKVRNKRHTRTLTMGGHDSTEGGSRYRTEYPASLGTTKGHMFDFTKKNIDAVKALKNQSYVQSKFSVQDVYERLQVPRVTNGNMEKLAKLGSLLHTDVK